MARFQSRINRRFDFNEQNEVAMHLVCYLPSVVDISKQHSAVLVERIDEGSLHLCKYDITAYKFKFEFNRFNNGKITNVREIISSAELSNNDAMDKLCNDKPKYVRTYIVSSGNFAKAREWFCTYQINTALGIARSFVNTHDSNTSDYFISQDALPPPAPELPIREGVRPVNWFLNWCSELVDSIERQDNQEVKQENASEFLKTIHQSSLKKFLNSNLAKMANDNLLSELLGNYAPQGSGFFSDTRRVNDRQPGEPVNCVGWAKDFMSEAGVLVLNPSDIPKIASKPCTIM